MAIFDTLIPNLFAADSVGVFDQNFNQVFVNARPIKAVIKKSKKVMEHPVETGVTITDHVVINPIEIELSMILNSLDYRNVYAQIENGYNKSTLYTVQTRSGSYSNMLIESMPDEQDPSRFNMIALALKLNEVQFVEAQFAKLPPQQVANKSNASTKQKGEVQSLVPTPAQDRSVLIKMSDYLTGNQQQ